MLRESIRMEIKKESPPSFRGREAKYGLILDALMKSGLKQWISVDAANISGASTKAKQNNLRQAAKYRGFDIKTTVVYGTLYIQLIAVNPYTEIAWPEPWSEE
jgi:hypothetical protein